MTLDFMRLCRLPPSPTARKIPIRHITYNQEKLFCTNFLYLHTNDTNILYFCQGYEGKDRRKHKAIPKTNGIDAIAARRKVMRQKELDFEL